MKVAIYTREKHVSGPKTGKWYYKRLNLGRGRKPADLKPPFFLRHIKPGGGRMWTRLDDPLESVIDAAGKMEAGLDAQAKGLTVTDGKSLILAGSNPNRTLIKIAVQDFLDKKRGKAPKTIAQYTVVLNQFLQHVWNKIRFIDEVTGDVLDGYKKFLETEGYAPTTIHGHLLIVCFLLKKCGVMNPTKLVDMPTVEEEPAEPYNKEQLEAFFAYFDRKDVTEEKKKELIEAKQRYEFFLGSSLREREVSFTEWGDIDFTKGTVRVHAKKDMGFTVKNHEARIVPLPTSVLEMLKERKKNASHARWIFVNEDGRPEGHFLRKLKSFAWKASLNCGRCETTRTEGNDENKHTAQVSCKDRPVCKQWKLHRFRKTRATRWMERGVPVRNIQHWLGHKSLETTMIYLGITGVEDLRDKIDAA